MATGYISAGFVMEPFLDFPAKSWLNPRRWGDWLRAVSPRSFWRHYNEVLLLQPRFIPNLPGG